MTATAALVVETSANEFFFVRDIDGIDHAWLGFRVKRVKGAWKAKAGARQVLVRKAATRIVQDT